MAYVVQAVICYINAENLGGVQGTGYKRAVMHTCSAVSMR